MPIESQIVNCVCFDRYNTVLIILHYRRYDNNTNNNGSSTDLSIIDTEFSIRSAPYFIVLAVASALMFSGMYILCAFENRMLREMCYMYMYLVIRH